MQFAFTDHGDLMNLTKKLEYMGKQARHTRPVMSRISLDMMEIEKKVFSSNGRRGGGSWAKLKNSTVRWKGSTAILRTRGSRPGYDSGKDYLFKSLTVKGAKYSVNVVTNNSVTFGTTRPAAVVHQTGSARNNTPARPFIKFTKLDQLRWDRWVLDHVTENFGDRRR